MSTQEPNAAAGDEVAGRLQKLIDIGIALSAERNHDRLMERILTEAQKLCNADGGTLYLRDEEDHLVFTIVHNDSLGVAMGGTTGSEITFPPLELYDSQTGARNEKNVATYAALAERTVNIADAYEAEDFDFSGTRTFDERTGYRSKSFLTVPLMNYDGDIIGVLQLINAVDTETGEVIVFGARLQQIVEALASQAAVALDNQMLLEARRDLLESFIRLIAVAIDEKSPYTSGHCQRVPVLAEMIAEAACQAHQGPFKDFSLTEDEVYELRIAAWMHDCGKVTTPEYVVDKSTKLETIYDRIDLVTTRAEILKRDAEIAYLRAVAGGSGDEPALRAERDATLARLADELAFIEKTNIGGEFLSDDDKERVTEIATRSWSDGEGEEVPFLSDDEIANLNISRGTLTHDEREIINNHVVVTIKMLEQLPFPKNLRRVPEYAGGHHERLDGSGYPLGLTRDQMSIPARMMALADIFEALTAADRPYKKAKPMTESIGIMSRMMKTDHIDAELFELFLKAGVYRKYAEKFLPSEQADEIDISAYLN